MFNWFKKKEEVVTETVVVLYIYFNSPNGGGWTSWRTTDLNNPWDEFITWYTKGKSKYFVIEDEDSANKDVIMRDTIARVEIRQEERVV